MGLDNPLHIAFLGIILLLVFGAKRLPELGRSLGAGMRGFKESISGEVGPAEHIEQLSAPPAAPATTVALAEPVCGEGLSADRSPIRPVA
jgi:sec-independent protein translocase protein TatA